MHPAQTLELSGQGRCDPRDLLRCALLRGLTHGERQLGVEVGALLASALTQAVRVEVPATDQVGEQLAAHPALGLGLGTVGRGARGR